MTALPRFFFGFRGRIGRRQFVLGFIIPLAMQFLIALLVTLHFSAIGQSVELLLAAIAAPVIPTWIALAPTAKRLQDRERPAAISILFCFFPEMYLDYADKMAASGAWILFPLAVAAFVVLWALTELCVLRGTRGPNQFGPDPLLPETIAP